jgi:hypothetical protein
MQPRLFLVPVALCLTLTLSDAAMFTVSTTADSGPGSLRQAIEESNTLPGKDEITFSVTGTIALSSTLPIVTESLVIVGPGTDQLTISGNNGFQVATFNAGTTSTVSGITIASGVASNYVNGAGVANFGTLTLVNSAFVNNRSFGGFGGGIYNAGRLSITNCAFVQNQAFGMAGSPNANNRGQT